MIVFVDWENVCGKEGSLDGVEYLTSNDILEIFYSERCPSMKNVDFEKLKMSTCKVNLTKLKTPRKNALDFYICCKIGIYLKEYNFKDINIGILSEDTGFDSCLDFISCISERENVWKARRNCINDLILYFKEPDKEHLLDGLKVINDSTPFDSLLEEYNKVLEQKLEEESRINNIIFEYEKMKSLLDGRDLNEIIDVYNASINSNKDELFSPETYDLEDEDDDDFSFLEEDDFSLSEEDRCDFDNSDEDEDDNFSFSEEDDFDSSDEDDDDFSFPYEDEDGFSFPYGYEEDDFSDSDEDEDNCDFDSSDDMFDEEPNSTDINKRVLEKIYDYDINGNALNRLKSYLENNNFVNLQRLYNDMVGMFGKDAGLVVYKLLRSDIKKLG